MLDFFQILTTICQILRVVALANLFRSHSSEALGKMRSTMLRAPISYSQNPNLKSNNLRLQRQLKCELWTDFTNTSDIYPHGQGYCKEG
jgi:hypothetical protein